MSLHMKLGPAEAHNLAAISEALESAKLIWASLSPTVQQSEEGVGLRCRLDAARGKFELVQRIILYRATPIASRNSYVAAWQRFG